MKLEKVRSQQQLDAIESLYMTAFPSNERKPFALMLEKSREGTMELLAIEGEAQEFIGLAIFVLYENMALLDYFAIADEKRGKGYGTDALKLLQTYYQGKRFFLEIEDAYIESENKEERMRRRGFYVHNEMQVMPFRVDLFGVIMEVLAYQNTITAEEYMQLYTEVFGRDKVLKNVKLLLDV